MLGVRAIEVEESPEDDRLVVDEHRATAVRIAGVDRRAGGEWRHLRTLWRVFCEIEHDDLDGLLAPKAPPEVREGDPTAVRTEGYRSSDPGQSYHAGRVQPDAEGRVAASGAEATRPSAAVGADEKHPFLLRR